MTLDRLVRSLLRCIDLIEVTYENIVSSVVFVLTLANADPYLGSPVVSAVRTRGDWRGWSPQLHKHVRMALDTFHVRW